MARHSDWLRSRSCPRDEAVRARPLFRVYARRRAYGRRGRHRSHSLRSAGETVDAIGRRRSVAGVPSPVARQGRNTAASVRWCPCVVGCRRRVHAPPVGESEMAGHAGTDPALLPAFGFGAGNGLCLAENYSFSLGPKTAGWCSVIQALLRIEGAAPSGGAPWWPALAAVDP